MKIFILAAAFSIAALFDSTTAMAQASGDANASAPVSKKAARAQNHKLSKSVRHALDTTKGLVSSNIAIIVKGGVVSLVGSVPDDSQIGVAGDAAKKVPNVKSVDNRLVVTEEGE